MWFLFCTVNAPQFWSLPWDGAGQPVFPRGGASIPGWQPHIMPGRRPTSPSEATSRFSLRQPQSWWADDDTPITQNEKLKLFTTCPNSGLYWWWADDEWMMSGRWADDKLLMRGCWIDDEHIMSVWWADDELIICGWWGDEDLMMIWWWADNELMMS